MKTLNNTTEKAQAMFRAWKLSDCFDIYEAYSRPSGAKVIAWHTCQKQCEEKNGYGLKITGHNSSFFSAGFMFEQDGKKFLQYITHCNDFIIELSEAQA